MSKIIGKLPINPILFITGKLSTYATWIVLLFHLISNSNPFSFPPIITKIAYYLLYFGLVITITTFINLGDATSLGTPEEKTKLKTKGLYKISRNPMYIGFNLLTISSFFINPILMIPGIYGIYIHHKIIIEEEKFLTKRFGNSYKHYCMTVKRYL